MPILLEVVPTELTTVYHQNARQVDWSLKKCAKVFFITRYGGGERAGEREREIERESWKYI